MRYLVIDACLNGTGIRDEYEGGYISLNELDLSPEIVNSINRWLLCYENEHYNGYINDILINELDNDGRKIASQIKKELGDVKISYYSDAKLTKEII